MVISGMSSASPVILASRSQYVCLNFSNQSFDAVNVAIHLCLICLLLTLLLPSTWGHLKTHLRWHIFYIMQWELHQLSGIVRVSIFYNLL